MRQRYQIIKDMGELGEKIVEEYISNAVRTDNWFDSTKDGTIDGERYEVKTFRLNKVHQGFLVDPSQYRKIDNVQHLFFVRIPEKNSDGIQVYRCENHIKAHRPMHINSGLSLRCYPITACKLLFTINDERCNILLNDSIAVSMHRRHA